MRRPTIKAEAPELRQLITDLLDLRGFSIEGEGYPLAQEVNLIAAAEGEELSVRCAVVGVCRDGKLRPVSFKVRSTGYSQKDLMLRLRAIEDAEIIS